MSDLITLIKQSDRTARKACNRCGSKDIYWARDPNAAPGKGFILIDANSVTRVVKKGDTVPVSSVHACSRNHAPEEPEHGEVTEDSTPEPVDVFALPEPAAAVWDALEAGQKIEAIKRYRSQTGLQLREAKAMVDAMHAGSYVKRVTTPAPTPAPVADDKAAALAALSALLSPSVDPETVREIVKAELDSIVFPTRTVVVQPNGDAKPVEGNTHPKLADIVTDLLAGEHVFMVGPAGTGKSHLAQQAAEALDREFYSLSVGPQTSKAEIMGYCSATGEYVPNGQFREAYENGGVFLFDEIDAGHPGVLTIMNAALANGHMSFPDRMVKRHPEFLCMASGNTFGRGADRKYQGRQAIDAATLDRFSVESIDYDESLERELCMATGLEPSKVNEVLAYVRYLRRKAEQHSLPVVMGMRASVGICRLLKAGRKAKDAIDARARRGLTDADWRKISEGAPTFA